VYEDILQEQVHLEEIDLLGEQRWWVLFRATYYQ
jgi:hypothetical protein